MVVILQYKEFYWVSWLNMLEANTRTYIDIWTKMHKCFYDFLAL